MKKFLRFLMVLLGIIVLGIVILGIVEPKDVSVSRSIVIAAPKDVVWEQIVKFKNWPHWSPWYEMEPTAEMVYSGEDGKVGSSYHWKGSDKKTGEGSMTNTGVKDGELDWSINFLKPMKGEAAGFFKLSDTTGGDIKVTWTFNTHCAFPMNAMNAFVNMDKMLGGDFEKGLTNMKKYCEAQAVAMPQVQIQEKDFAAQAYAGVHKVVSWNDMSKFFMDTYTALGKEAGSKISGHAAGLYWKWDTVNHNADMAAVFPVSDTSKPIKGASFFYVPASKAYMTVLKGTYSGMMNAHMVLGKYVMNKKQMPAMVVEEYVIGPHENPDSTKWETNIYYLVK